MSTQRAKLKDPKIFQCNHEDCGKTFSRAFNFSRHVRAVHPNSQVSTRVLTPGSPSSSTVSTPLGNHATTPTSSCLNAISAPPPMLLDQTTALSATGPNPISTPLSGSPGQIPVTDPFSVGSNPKDDSTIGDGPDSNDFLGNGLFRSGHSTGWADMMWKSDLMESGNMMGAAP
ncbi:hypothetical protein XANCAGTX0491_004484 [Xanthoria calcicola]